MLQIIGSLADTLKKTTFPEQAATAQPTSTTAPPVLVAGMPIQPLDLEQHDHQVKMACVTVGETREAVTSAVATSQLQTYVTREVITHGSPAIPVVLTTRQVTPDGNSTVTESNDKPAGKRQKKNQTPGKSNTTASLRCHSSWGSGIRG